MKFQLKTLIIVMIILSLSLPVLSFSTAWRSFILSTPEEVSANPGQEIVINGTILNTGWWWLHYFNLTLEGLPEGYSYNVTPSYWQDLMILRDWNPKDGVFRVPEPFLISINIPKEASGLYAITVKGQEHQSYYLVSNTTTFVLKVLGAPPKLSIGNINLPSTVTQNETFNSSFEVNNEGQYEMTVTATMLAPANWTISPSNLSLTIKPSSSAIAEYMITPTESSGKITAMVEYSYLNKTENITKEGPFVSPQPKVPIQPPAIVLPDLTTIFEKYSPLLITIVAVIVIVIAWILWSMYKIYSVRKSPEKMKKTTEAATQNPEVSPDVQ